MTPTPERGAATIEQVARVAGVSRSTVSRVLGGGERVSPEALTAVREAISALNYVPSRAARSLASRQTHAIALIVPEDTTRFFGDPYFAAIVSGIESRLRETDYILNLFIASDDPRSKTASYIESGNVDGAIVVSHHTSDTYVERIAQAVPVVYGGRPVRTRDGDYFVDVDNVLAGEEATAYLISRGARRIGMITGPRDMRAGIDRLEGHRRALAAVGLPEGPIEDGGFTRAGGAEAARRILDGGEPFDALFVASDLMARGAIDALRDADLRVPDDVLIVGFDDSPVAIGATPALTTIRQPSFHAGELITNTLLSRLRGEPAEHATVLPTELIIRDSA
ncbi:LacI family DNA-binding transcriptional regulator [Microbacterium amylolyticum]|uniref:LacI family transcriptional regulator n=1 Tax=Microbacterium amylolyticum TaxID=936337 RepID=A0ABS4ZGM5_9MICO|nr:LacI family DNA-binding transcriptional regulator [Microbacterium amylolyticum]MBP2436437.1 LacI family transcriptional regulator [Microbacterium amylolyticum]